MQQIAFSIIDAARSLSVGRSMIYVLLNSGKLESIKIGRRNLITASSLARLVGSAPQQAQPERASSF